MFLYLNYSLFNNRKYILLLIHRIVLVLVLLTKCSTNNKQIIVSRKISKRVFCLFALEK